MGIYETFWFKLGITIDVDVYVLYIMILVYMILTLFGVTRGEKAKLFSMDGD